MSGVTFAESVVEEAALAWLESVSWTVGFGPALAPDGADVERSDWRDPILPSRLRYAIERLNRHLKPEAIEDVLRQVSRLGGGDLAATNREGHRLLVEGVPIQVRHADGSIRGESAKLIDLENPAANDWFAVNQFTMLGADERRPDIVLFVNGLPLAVIELKNAADEKATVWAAFNQLQTYKLKIPALFGFNVLLAVSDGLVARVGSLTADRERFLPWRTIEGEELAPPELPQLEVMIRGVLEHRRFLEVLRHYVVFEDEGGGKLAKKIAGYHQFWAVRRAVAETVRATETMDRRIGVIWHTQGSGKSLTMVFYAGRLVVEQALRNPTIVVLTDRNDLDGQLFGTFSRCAELLRQAPEQATGREDLARRLSERAAGGVIFATVQKFMPREAYERMPLLSDRRNIVVIADEAHRSQYDFIDGFARHLRDALPNAAFIGFTGTPIALDDRNTRAVFGDYISVYDIRRAIEDGATVPIYYESRLAKLALDEAHRPQIDPDFDEITENEEEEVKQRVKTRWAQLEAVAGADRRIEMVAEDLVKHLEQREEALEGKAMVVTMSRRICVALHDAIVRLRPGWHDPDDSRGAVKVVMTGNATDELTMQPHIRNKVLREDLAKRFKDARDPLKLVIVRDMWLTGFDVPCLHTMYVDKPMRGHGLMQAIARVNRVFKDKPGGLIVDYLGIARELREAVSEYTQSGGAGEPTIDQEEAVKALLAAHEVCVELFRGFSYSLWLSGTSVQRLSLLPPAIQHILKQENGKERLLAQVQRLSDAFALAVPDERALAIQDDVGFFQAVRTGLLKLTTQDATPADQLDHAVRQLVSKAIASDRVIDVFAAAGISRPDVSILSDEFLAEVQEMPHRNVALELLKRLLTDEIATRRKRHLVQARSFEEMLAEVVRKYDARAIEAAQVIEALIDLARKMNAAQRRGEELGLSEDEIAFYEALEVNDSAVRVLGEPTLKAIARELVKSVQANRTIDWTIRESVRAKLRVIVKRILRKHGYPPDKQAEATETVLKQAELLEEEWAKKAA